MKKFHLTILNKTGQLLGWKWLYFIAGIGLISSIQSCKPVTKHCYKPAVTEDDTIVQPSCYDMPAPVDTNEIYEPPTDSNKAE